MKLRRSTKTYSFKLDDYSDVGMDVDYDELGFFAVVSHDKPYQASARHLCAEGETEEVAIKNLIKKIREFADLIEANSEKLSL